jgi:hypothetical protein
MLTKPLFVRIRQGEGGGGCIGGCDTSLQNSKLMYSELVIQKLFYLSEEFRIHEFRVLK